MELSINYMSANFFYTIVNCKNTFFFCKNQKMCTQCLNTQVYTELIINSLYDTRNLSTTVSLQSFF